MALQDGPKYPPWKVLASIPKPWTPLGLLFVDFSLLLFWGRNSAPPPTFRVFSLAFEVTRWLERELKMLSGTSKPRKKIFLSPNCLAARNRKSNAVFP